MIDRYAVIGNPIAHSKSPLIHRLFAGQTAQTLSYEAMLAPLDGFAACLASFWRDGGRGANITIPFKLEAYALADQLTPRAAAAGAVNTLMLQPQGVLGDNTDGAGLVRDLEQNLGCQLAGARILLLGAGGAARGAILPLLERQPARLMIANRSTDKAIALADRFNPMAGSTSLGAGGFADVSGEQFDLVINATAASLAAQAPPLPAGCYAADATAYDMMYGSEPTIFLQAALNQGASRVADGLGMLVEQAAESFALWRGVLPDTAAVLTELRAGLRG